MHSLVHQHLHMHQHTHQHDFTPILHQSVTIQPAPMGTQDSSVRRCFTNVYIDLAVILFTTLPISIWSPFWPECYFGHFVLIATKNNFKSLPFTSCYSSTRTLPDQQRGPLLLRWHRSPTDQRWVQHASLQTDMSIQLNKTTVLLLFSFFFFY